MNVRVRVDCGRVLRQTQWAGVGSPRSAVTRERPGWRSAPLRWAEQSEQVAPTTSSRFAAEVGEGVVEVTHPGLVPALEKLVDPVTHGDPES